MNDGHSGVHPISWRGTESKGYKIPTKFLIYYVYFVNHFTGVTNSLQGRVVVPIKWEDAETRKCNRKKPWW